MIILIMGVAGAGKTTIGELLASQLGWSFVDADSYHSPENIRKMSEGIPLTDEDRAPWIAALHSAIEKWLKAGQNIVLAASALKKSYRDALALSDDVKLVYLRGTPELIRSRLLARHNHYMDPNLLGSQFRDLEEPEAAVIENVSKTPAQIVSEIRTRLSV